MKVSCEKATGFYISNSRYCPVRLEMIWKNRFIMYNNKQTVQDGLQLI
jgi:hypothetical protein